MKLFKQKERCCFATWFPFLMCIYMLKLCLHMPSYTGVMESQSIFYFLCRQTCFMFVIILKSLFRFIKHQLGSRDSESNSFPQADQLLLERPRYWLLIPWGVCSKGTKLDKAIFTVHWLIKCPLSGDPGTVLAPSVMMTLYQFPCSNPILLSKMPLPCLLSLELL